MIAERKYVAGWKINGEDKGNQNIVKKTSIDQVIQISLFYFWHIWDITAYYSFV